MTGTITVMRREYASYFRTAAGWVVMALFLVLAGAVFRYFVLQPGQPASMRPFFAMTWGVLLFLAPAISMKTFSEELRTGTIEPLLTAPVSETGVVVGKYLAAVLYLCTMLAPTLVYAAVLSGLSAPDYGAMVAGYLGVLLLGMLYLAAGVLASAATQSQPLAFLGPLFGFLALEVLRSVAVSRFPRWAADVVLAVAPGLRIQDFAKGVIDTRHVVFFLAGTAWFLAATTLLVQARRWR
ncbi:MAG: ABC transporter permease subunit [Phycisphaerales bacterium]|nr:ABC transporter permease subunit [Phycisphaerales bacterium]